MGIINLISEHREILYGIITGSLFVNLFFKMSILINLIDIFFIMILFSLDIRDESSKDLKGGNK